MIHEALAVVWGLALLTAIGAGPAMWLVTRGEKHLQIALGIAPALGVALFGALGIPLVRYVAPVQRWAIPLTVVAIVASAALVAVYVRRNNLSRAQFALTIRPLLAGVGFVLVVIGFLVTPLLVNGIQYTIFRSNPSDAFYFMSLAETVRTTDWSTLEAGTDLRETNRAGLAALAQVSPTALLTARFNQTFTQVSMPSVMAWFSQVSGLSVFRAYYSFELLQLTLAACVALVIGALLELPRALNMLGACAVAFGFWARFVLEMDASAAVTGIPMTLLFVFALIQLEGISPRLFSAERLLFALTSMALLCLYIPIVPIIGIALGVYYGFCLLTRRTSLRALSYHLATVGIVIGGLLVTGQLGNTLSLLRFLIFTNSNSVSAFPPHHLQVILEDKLAGFWGLPRSYLFEIPNSLRGTLVRRAADFLALIPSISLAVAGWIALRKAAKPPQVVLAAIVFTALSISAGMFLLGRTYLASRVIGYTFPYFILGALLPTAYLYQVRNTWLRHGILLALAAWLLVQLAIGVFIPFNAKPLGLFRQSVRHKQHQFDLAPIQAYLKENPPRLLLVNIPRDEQWTFAYYTMFLFKEYPSYLQSGIVVDNSVLPQNLWFTNLEAAPDFAVMLRSADYLRDTAAATLVAETEDLVLYRVTDADPELFVEQDKRIRELEKAKPYHAPPPLQ